jgi:hypothetical protein
MRWRRVDPTETPSALGVLVVLSGGVGETPTPPALDEHAFGVAHVSTDVNDSYPFDRSVRVDLT